MAIFVQPLSIQVSSYSEISYGSPASFETGSPPSDQIIRGSNLHPRTMGTTDSTKKLCFVPKSKTADSNKVKPSKDNDRIFKNPLFGRLLSAVPPLKIHLNENIKNEITIPVIEEGMIESLIRLNEIFEKAQRCVDFHDINNADNQWFENYCFYNSYHALASFNNVTEVYRSNQRIIYRLKSRIDQQWYCVKTGINYSEPDNIRKLSISNYSLLRDIQILSTLNHVNIVKYHKCWLEQQSFFLQIEYLLGESIYYFMFSTNYDKDNIFGNRLFSKDKFPLINKISECAARHILKQISKALNYLHERKIVHNDIQPSHILITCNQYDIDDANEKINTIRSLIYKSLIGEVHMELTYKLIDFSKSFYVDKYPIDHLTPYIPILNKLGGISHMYNRDIQGLAMSIIHGLSGPQNFFPRKIRDYGVIQELECKNRELKIILAKMMNSEILMNSYDLMKEVRFW